MTDTMNEIQKKPTGFKKYLPFIILALFIVGVSYLVKTFVDPQLIVEKSDELQTIVENNFLLVLIGFIVLYAVLTVFMIPASILTIASGFLFGIYIGAPAVVVGATIGACGLFLASQSFLRDRLRDIAGPFLDKMEAGYKESPIAYLFTLRLIPAVPFAVANIAPSFLGAKFRDYFLTTAVGIIPGTVAYSLIGSGIRNTLSNPDLAGEEIVVSKLIADTGKDLLPAIIALLLVSLIPIIYKKFIKKAPAQA